MDKRRRVARPETSSEPPLNEILTVRVGAEDLEELNRLILVSGRSASDILRDALREYLNTKLGARL